VRLHDERTDLQLVEAARAGDNDAVVELWQRHYSATMGVARRVARQPRDAEELASDAFARMLSAMSTGGGPTASVRAYLATSVRNLAVSRIRHSSSGEVLTDDDGALERLAADGSDPVARHGELGIMREAFAALPKRWQVVLWRTAVDQDSNIAVAQELGLSPNAVAALTRRARKGLRTAYLQAHVSIRGVDAACAPHVALLADLATGQSVPAATRAHVEGCARCQARVAELTEVETRLSGLLGPAILGLASSTPLAAGGAGGTVGSEQVVEATTRAGQWTWRAKGLLAGTAAVAVAAAAWALADRGEPPTPPLVAPTTTTVVPTPSATTTTTRPPTTTTTTATTVPTRTTTTRPTPTAPRTATSRPAPPPPPSSPRTTPPATTSIAMTPLVAELSVTDDRTTTSLALHVEVEGTRGPLTAQVSLPSGVRYSSSSGDWGQCRQSGSSVTCTGAHEGDGVWDGSIAVRWPPGVSGRVVAEVAGTYANGSPARGSVGTTWSR
jgi:RNA polymerase sigma factor (sigma-70 family)